MWRWLRRVLEGIQYLRFPMMNAEEFARAPAEDAVLTDEVSLAHLWDTQHKF